MNDHSIFNHAQLGHTPSDDPIAHMRGRRFTWAETEQHKAQGYIFTEFSHATDEQPMFVCTGYKPQYTHTVAGSKDFSPKRSDRKFVMSAPLLTTKHRQ